MDLLSIKNLDDLANLVGIKSYLDLRGLIYPQPKYNSFKLQKKTGGERTIHVPRQLLGEIQRRLAKELLIIYGQGPVVVNSFLPKRGIVKNALPHVGRGIVIRFDLENFFPSINFGRVKGLFKAKPFKFPDHIATVLAHICCYQNQLPQGAPTSPIISNFLAFSLDKKLIGIAHRYKARYTRYSDDLTFSFRRSGLHQLPQELILKSGDDFVAGPKIVEAVLKSGFKLNDKKTKVATSRQRQMVTGIVVNKGLNLPNRFVGQIRRALFVWNKSGYKAAQVFAPPVLHRRQTASGKVPRVERIIRGKLLFLRMVKGASDPVYQRFALQYNDLIARDASECLADNLKIDPVVISGQDAQRATYYLEAEDDDGKHACHAGTAISVENVKGWVTCAHCVGSIADKKVYKKIRLFSSDWKSEYPVEVFEIDWDRDIAFLRSKSGATIPANQPYFKWIDKEPEADSRVATIGFPSQNLYQPSSFMRARIVRIRKLKAITRVEIDKTILAGNSGGALFDENYRIVGVVQERATDDGGSNSSIFIREIANLIKA